MAVSDEETEYDITLEQLMEVAMRVFVKSVLDLIQGYLLALGLLGDLIIVIWIEQRRKENSKIII